MEWVETTAKTVEDAQERLLDQLGIDAGEADFEVIEEPRRGLLGRMKGEARVRARVRPTQPRPKVDDRSRRRSGGGGQKKGRGGNQGGGAGRNQGGGGGQGGGNQGGGGDRNQGGRGQGGGNQGGNQGGGGGRNQGGRGQGGGNQGGSGGRGKEAAAAAAAGAGATVATGAAVANDRSSNDRSSNEPSSNERPARESNRSPKQEPRKDDTPRMNVDQQAEVASSFITGLAEEFGASNLSTETVKIDDQLAEVRLTGDDVGLMIGPKGGTLQAIQELTKTVLQRACGGAGDGRIRIDIGGFRQRRREALEQFVLSLVDDVKDSDRSKALEPMNSADRKVVHDVLSEVDGVETSSEGDDPHRRVVINPA